MQATKRRLFVPLVAALFAMLMAAPAGMAQTPPEPEPGTNPDGQGNLCSYDVNFSFDPPMGAPNGSPLNGHIQTNNGAHQYAETGDIDCEGATFEGPSVTGPGAGSVVTGWGTFGLRGAYTGGCVGGMSQGLYTATFPTAEGPVYLTGEYLFGWGTFFGGFRLSMGNQTMDSGFAGYPIRGGPCIPAVERAHLAGEGVLH